jgi:hypothetical protein
LDIDLAALDLRKLKRLSQAMRLSGLLDEWLAGAGRHVGSQRIGRKTSVSVTPDDS